MDRVLRIEFPRRILAHINVVFSVCTCHFGIEFQRKISELHGMALCVLPFPGIPGGM